MFTKMCFDLEEVPVEVVDAINKYRDTVLNAPNLDTSTKILFENVDYEYWIISYLTYLVYEKEN